MRVMLDMFSGRPNPQFPLSPFEAAQLVARANALRWPALPGTSLHAGWRGFIVWQDDPFGVPLPSIRVHAGIVESQRTAFRDTSGLEAMLMALSRQRGFGDLIDAARSAAHGG